jgi:hypothetical protein
MARIIDKAGYADRRRLAGSKPLQLVDPVLNGTLVRGSRCALFYQKLLGHPRIDASRRRQSEGINDREDSGICGHAVAPCV